MGKDYSEYVPSEQEQYRRRRRGNQFIELEYFINSVRFNAERKTLDIQVDGKKESLWMDELVEEYEVAREERFGEEFLGLEEASEEDWKENEEDVERRLIENIEKAAQRFSWERMGEVIERFYE